MDGRMIHPKNEKICERWVHVASGHLNLYHKAKSLATNNEREFLRVVGLSVENWAK
jgi:hypothetical protein